MKLLILASLLILPSLSYAGLKCDTSTLKCAKGIDYKKCACIPN